MLGIQICLGRAGDQISVHVKARAMAGAVPALFIRIPFELAAKMRAAHIDRMQGTRFVLEDADFFTVHRDDSAVTAGKLCRLRLRYLKDAPGQAFDCLRALFCYPCDGSRVKPSRIKDLLIGIPSFFINHAGRIEYRRELRADLREQDYYS